MANFTVLRGILAAFLMKVCHKIVEISFSSMDPAFFRQNDTEGGRLKCSFDESDPLSNLRSSFTTWIYTARYLLPVLGGLVSSAWLGYVRVLQIGGAIMLLASVLMSVSVYLGLICQASPIIPVTWLLLPLFFGLTQPNLLFALYMWYNLPKLSAIIPALYYFAVMFGEWLTSALAPLSEAGNLGSNSTLMLIVLSVLFIALSFLLPKDSNQEPFEMPTRSRMIRYFQIFSGLILFMFSVGDIRSVVYMKEIFQFMNGTTYFAEYTWLSPKWVNTITVMVTCLILVLIGPVYPKKLPVQPRMQLGILLESAVAVSLAIFTVVGSSSPTAVATVYSVASALDGFTEAAVIIAVYDLVPIIAPRNSQALVFGNLFTVWGLSNFAIRVFIVSLGQMQNYVYHVVTAVALVVALVYNHCLAFPLAKQLMLVYEVDDAGNPISLEQEDQRRPLLNHSDLQ